MSAYSDAMNKCLIDDMENKFRSKRSHLRDYLLNQNKWIILLICLVVLLIYCWILSMLFSFMQDVYAKHEYFEEHLKKERDQLNTIKQELDQFKEEIRNKLKKYDPDCHRCWHSLSNVRYDQIFSYIWKYNRTIKQSYDDTLAPLQCLLFEIYYLNTFSMTMIFKMPFQLFFLSSLLAIINLCIYNEVFIADTPNVYYTLSIGICIFLFSIFLLCKIIMVLLNVVHHQIMKDNLIGLKEE